MKKNNSNKIIWINGLITGIIGSLLMTILVTFQTQPIFGPSEPLSILDYIAYVCAFLLVPSSIYTTRLFVQQGYKKIFTGSLFGGLFSLTNALIISLLVTIISSSNDDSFGILVLSLFATIPISFVIGAVAGAVITAITRKKKKK